MHRKNKEQLNSLKKEENFRELLKETFSGANNLSSSEDIFAKSAKEISIEKK